MKKIKKLLDFYTNPRKNGIFYAMSFDTELNSLLRSLGIEVEQDYHSMDFDYLYNSSGLKTVSVMLEKFIYGYVIDSDDEFVVIRNNRKVTWDYIITEVDRDIINFVIKTKYLKKWTELVKTLNQDYDILSPYNMDISDTTKDTMNSSGSDSRTSNGDSKSTTEQTNEGENHEQTYGFNSTNPVPSNDSNNNSTTNISNTDETNTTSRGTNKYERNNDIVRTISRKGNIGNKSAQELIEEQREMLKYQIFDTIYSDLDDILTRSKYN